MIQIKNLFDAADESDGLRLWIGPIGLTKDLAVWCRVDRWLREGSPSPELAQWHEEHPDGWEYFRAKHHDSLAQGGHAPLLRELSRRAMRENITLLYEGSSQSQNAAVSLHEYLSELQLFCSDELWGCP